MAALPPAPESVCNLTKSLEVPTVVILRSFRPVRPDRNGGSLPHGRSGSIAWLNLTHLSPAGFDHAAASVRHATWRGRGLASLRTRAGLSDEGSDHHRTVHARRHDRHPGPAIRQ